MTKFIQLVPLKYGDVREPITINIDCIKSVLKHDIYLSKVFVCDDMIEHPNIRKACSYFNSGRGR